MTARGFYTLLFGLVMLVTSLSVGSGGVFLLGCVALIAWALALVSVLLARATFSLSEQMDSASVLRGESCRYSLSIRLFAPIPIAPVSLRLCLPSGRESEFILAAEAVGMTQSDNAFPCPHVGVFPVGVVQAALSDCFGLFTLRRRITNTPALLSVLPNPAKTAPLTFSPGEGETGTDKRAQSDHTTPEDVRLWQDGDELKRVHWKLSMRRQELLVHTYETPQRPDALILLDCAPPQAPAHLRAAVIDALCESCAGVASELLGERHIVRLPLPNDRPREISGQAPEALHDFQLALSQEGFSRPSDFARVLLLSSRRMRRTGSTVILSSRLTPKIADAAIALSRMGPHTRFTLVTAAELTAQEEKLLYLLLSSGLEATHVRTRAAERARA